MPLRKGQKVMQRKWTTDERRTLRRMHVEGMTFREIGLALRRPKGSCWSQALDMGLTGRRRPKWTAGQNRIIDVSLDALVDSLALRFGRTTGGVRGQLCRRLFAATKRDRIRAIPDLGGMRVAS